MSSNRSSQLRSILEAAIGPQAVPAALDDSTPLLGAIPELDSMAVVAILEGIQQMIAVPIEDDEVSADIFLTFGALRQFVDARATA